MTFTAHFIGIVIKLIMLTHDTASVVVNVFML